jgi:proteasome lid subunit RPN8/RPN11
MSGEFLYHSVTKLGKHPSEVDLSLSQMADVIWAGREAEKVENSRWEALIKSLAGRVI